jgi:hypothetical protein
MRERRRDWQREKQEGGETTFHHWHLSTYPALASRSSSSWERAQAALASRSSTI